MDVTVARTNAEVLFLKRRRGGGICLRRTKLNYRRNELVGKNLRTECEAELFYLPNSPLNSVFQRRLMLQSFLKALF